MNDLSRRDALRVLGAAAGALGVSTAWEKPLVEASVLPLSVPASQLPTATATSQPTATATSQPTATATPQPTATATPQPTATATPLPTVDLTMIVDDSCAMFGFAPSGTSKASVAELSDLKEDLS